MYMQRRLVEDGSNTFWYVHHQVQFGAKVNIANTTAAQDLDEKAPQRTHRILLRAPSHLFDLRA
ncbi:hypothetical protein PMIN06_011709 [Paraphaeosphaeria minitans]